MIYENTPQLSGWLTSDGWAQATMGGFEIDEAEYRRHYAALVGRPASERSDAAAYRCLTFDQPVKKTEAPKPQQIIAQQDQILKQHAATTELLKGFHDRQAEKAAGISAQVAQLYAQEAIAHGSTRQAVETVGESIAEVNRELLIRTGEIFSAEKRLEYKIDTAETARLASLEDERIVRAKERKHAWIRFAITTLLLLALILLTAVRGHAQNTNGNLVVATCGTPPTVFPAAGSRAPNTVDTNGNLCAGVTVSATIATNGLAISVSAGASTSGVAGTPIFGAAGASAPTYTTGYQPLSMDTSGNLRVSGSFSPAANQTVDLNKIEGASFQSHPAGLIPVILAGTSGTIGAVTIGSTVNVAWLTASPNVTISSALPAGSAVIGHVIVDTTSTTAVTQATGTNLHAVIDTGSTTAVTQATGTNLHTVVDSGTITTVSTVSAVGGTVTTAFLTANIATNLAQVAGTTVSVGLGTSGTGTQRIVVATGDPCSSDSGLARGFVAISTTTSATIITGATSNFVYICAVNIGPIGPATNVALVTGTGTVCATNIAGIFGGTTAATGWVFAANGGLTWGSGGATLAKASLTAGNVCILVSAANQVSGGIAYVLSP